MFQSALKFPGSHYIVESSDFTLWNTDAEGMQTASALFPLPQQAVVFWQSSWQTVFALRYSTLLPQHPPLYSLLTGKFHITSTLTLSTLRPCFFITTLNPPVLFQQCFQIHFNISCVTAAWSPSNSGLSEGVQVIEHKWDKTSLLGPLLGWVRFCNDARFMCGVTLGSEWVVLEKTGRMQGILASPL